MSAAPLLSSRRAPGRTTRRGRLSLVAAAPASVRYADLFPGAYQVLQTDLGLTYGPTPLAEGTTPPVGTLSGALTKDGAKPIWFKPTTPGVVGAGAVFAAYADGLGVTPFQTGITPSVGIPVPLTGPAAGISMAWGAGTAAANNTWKATCAGLADQTVNGINSGQPLAASQPVLATGLNGKPSLLFDGVDDFMVATGLVMPLPYLILVVARYVVAKNNANVLVSGDSFAGTIYQNIITATAQYSGVIANPQPFADLTINRFAGVFGNTTADSLKIGGNAPSTGTATGPVNTTTRSIGATTTPSQLANAEIYAVIYTPVVPYAAFDAALNSPGGYGPGSVLV